MNGIPGMLREAAETPAVVAHQLRENAAALSMLGARLRELAPRAVVTCARGSSDHAATFARYLIEMYAGTLTSSAAPSLSSLYAAQPDLRGTLFLAISQSGRSPDLLAAAANARARGACVIALCNAPDSPLGTRAHHTIALHAGEEKSVAATKSYIASLAAIVHLLACWTGERALLEALRQLPQQLQAAWELDWSGAVPVLAPAVNLFVAGRGCGLGVAQEAALKLKETCRLHAEAFSAAEVQHGPIALIEPGFPVLLFSQDDASRAGLETLAGDFLARGATVLLAGAQIDGALTLPTLRAHPAIEPLLMIHSFYHMVPALARARGLDPDAPLHLRKVTETL